MAPVTGTEVGRGADPAARPADVGGDSASVTGGSAHRAIAVELAAVRRRFPNRAPRVLDVGGGSGAWAVPLAKAGCAVVVVDPSPNALAALVRRARDAGARERVTPVSGDVDALADVAAVAHADLVLGHGLLEVVDDVTSAVRAMTQAAAPGGVVSVLVAGRFAAVLARTLAGRLAEARAVLADPDGRFGPDDALRRRLDAAGLRRVLGADPDLRLELLQGDGVLDGWLPGAVRDAGPAAAGQIGELEERAAMEPALIDVAARLHAIARRVS
jgi:S-adenosylmethionine-dependent methyltransferase